mgnify:CR=1 FL=1
MKRAIFSLSQSCDMSKLVKRWKPGPTVWPSSVGAGSERIMSHFTMVLPSRSPLLMLFSRTLTRVLSAIRGWWC